MKIILPLATVLLLIRLAALTTADEPQLRPSNPWKLLFSSSQDLTDSWGMIHFGTSALRHLQTCKDPGFELSYCSPRTDGGWNIFGLKQQQLVKHNDQVRQKNVWFLIRATTRDGLNFENMETVFEGEPGPWTHNHALAYNPETKEFLLLKVKMDDNGFRYIAFFSPDGRIWKEHPKNPLFYDGDAISLFWDPVLRCFVLISKSLQFVPASVKRIPDHGGKCRRVLSIRSSRDGRQWKPSTSMEDVWERLKRSKGGTGFKPLPDELLTVPDELDPPDLQFYSGNGFWHHDRAYMMVLNYAASPMTAGKHGPHLDTEWWVGRDGLHWERPGRNVNALGDVFPKEARITHNPMIINGNLLFHFRHHLIGMKQDRLSYVGARANAEFSTVPFQMPQADLLLNASIPAPDRPFGIQQAYVMVAVVDKQGSMIPGFEAEKCLIRKEDRIDVPLKWGVTSARQLAGQTIRLRFFLRSANIYAVTARTNP